MRYDPAEFTSLLVVLFIVIVAIAAVGAYEIYSEGVDPPDWKEVESPDAEVTCWRHRTRDTIVCSPTTLRGLEC
jgi:hypothetical protein